MMDLCFIIAAIGTSILGDIHSYPLLIHIHLQICMHKEHEIDDDPSIFSMNLSVAPHDLTDIYKQQDNGPFLKWW